MIDIYHHMYTANNTLWYQVKPHANLEITSLWRHWWRHNSETI